MLARTQELIDENQWGAPEIPFILLRKSLLGFAFSFWRCVVSSNQNPPSFVPLPENTPQLAWAALESGPSADGRPALLGALTTHAPL